MAAMSDFVKLTKVRRLLSSGAAKGARVAAGLSLREMAAAAQIDPSTLWRWEEGQRIPHGAQALRYFDALQELLAAA